MGEEYTEQKTRVYKAKKHGEEGKLSKYFVSPITKMITGKPKEEDHRRGRLTA